MEKSLCLDLIYVTRKGVDRGAARTPPSPPEWKRESRYLLVAFTLSLRPRLPCSALPEGEASWLHGDARATQDGGPSGGPLEEKRFQALNPGWEQLNDPLYFIHCWI